MKSGKYTPGIYPRSEFSFAFDLLIQIIKFKTEAGLDISADLNDLFKVIEFNKSFEYKPYKHYRKRIAQDIDEIKQFKFKGIDILRRFDEQTLTHCLTGTLERYYRYYLKLEKGYVGSRELDYLLKLRSSLFKNGKPLPNVRLEREIEQYQKTILENRVGRIAEIYLGVVTAFMGFSEVKSQTEFRIIAGLIAIQQNLADMKKLKNAIEGQVVYQYLLDLTSGAYKKLLKEKIISPKHFQPALMAGLGK